MSKIKTALERFQSYCAAKGIPEKSSLAHIHKISQFEEHERKELRAAYEALKAENEAQAKRIAELEKGLTEISEWTKRYTTPGHPISTVADRLLAAAKNGDSK